MVYKTSWINNLIIDACRVVWIILLEVPVLLILIVLLTR